MLLVAMRAAVELGGIRLAIIVVHGLAS